MTMMMTTTTMMICHFNVQTFKPSFVLRACLNILLLNARCYASAILADVAVIVCLPFVRFLSVCPSVCHKSEFYKTAKPRITQTTPYDSLRLVFNAKHIDEIPTRSPLTGAPKVG